MKNVKSLLLVSVLTASFGLGTSEAWTKDGILSSVKSGESSYCHIHFPAMVESTLASDRPVLKELAREISSIFMGRAIMTHTEKRRSKPRSVMNRADGGRNIVTIKSPAMSAEEKWRKIQATRLLWGTSLLGKLSNAK